LIIILSYLAGWGCNNHLEKYEFVNGKDDKPYMKWKIKMFETTKQLYEPWSILTIWLMVIPSIIRILIMVIINPYEPLDD